MTLTIDFHHRSRQQFRRNYCVYRILKLCRKRNSVFYSNPLTVIRKLAKWAYKMNWNWKSGNVKTVQLYLIVQLNPYLWTRSSVKSAATFNRFKWMSSEGCKMWDVGTTLPKNNKIYKNNISKGKFNRKMCVLWSRHLNTTTIMVYTKLSKTWSVHWV